MSSYISTQSISGTLRQSVMKMQAELAAAQTEISSGRHADIGLSLGGGAGASVSLQAQGALLQTFATANAKSLAMVDIAQTQLSDLQSSAQSLLNMLISRSEPGTIVAAGKNELKKMIAGLNVTLDGDHLFAGLNTAAAPIADYFAPSSSAKAAVDSTFAATFGMTQSDALVSTIDGTAMQSFLDGPFNALFRSANWTNDWSSASDVAITTSIAPGQKAAISASANESAFRALAEAYTMVSELGVEKLDTEAYDILIGKARDLVTTGLDSLIDIETGLGVAQSDISDANARATLQVNILTSEVSDLESVNVYAAQTRIVNLQTQLETSYALTSELKKLSLVNYL